MIRSLTLRPDAATENSHEPLMTRDDLARYLAVKPSWIYEAVRSKGMPHFKVGRHLRFSRVAIDRWLQDHFRGAA